MNRAGRGFCPHFCAAMFWRLGFQSTSTLDALLQREHPPTVEELLDEQDLLSEIKTGNTKWAICLKLA